MKGGDRELKRMWREGGKCVNKWQWMKRGGGGGKRKTGGGGGGGNDEGEAGKSV